MRGQEEGPATATDEWSKVYDGVSKLVKESARRQSRTNAHKTLIPSATDETKAQDPSYNKAARGAVNVLNDRQKLMAQKNKKAQQKAFNPYLNSSEHPSQ